MKALTQQQISAICTLVQRTSNAIMAFYQTDLNIQIKQDDSPVTQADLIASKMLEDGLSQIANYPVLSEENTPKTADWLHWETYWIIDPIDGTKHFINGTNEFCICIALIHQNRAVFGFIFSPISQTAWFAQSNDKVIYKQTADNDKQICQTCSPQTITATISSNHLTARMQSLLSLLPNYQWYCRGSALKYIDIVEGEATLYPKMWDTCEWDSAAGHCLLECAGGAIINLATGETLAYGKSTSLINPHFLAYRGLSEQQVQQICQQYLQLVTQ